MRKKLRGLTGLDHRMEEKHSAALLGMWTDSQAKKVGGTRKATACQPVEYVDAEPLSLCSLLGEVLKK